MEKVVVGDRLKIECYKHNGLLDCINDEAIVLEVTEDYLIVANDHTKLTEHDGRSHRTREPAVLFFYKHDWFNVIGQLKEQGLFYYCNIATPYLIENKTIKYIDYDLDLRVFPDGGFRVLDRNEYKYHKKIMHYSDEIDQIVHYELGRLIDMKKQEKGPFTPNLVVNLYQRYKKMKKM
ncbi:MAG: DUF402 domain-containing protein [Bacilli bacterium]|nr:DUF402 domain-containing protein [Bacilli bacterium]